MTGRPGRRLLIICAAVGGAVAGFVLLQLLLGGRYDFPDQCSPQPGGVGGTKCTTQGYGPRSVGVDIVAAGIGAAVGALVAVLATRTREALGASATATYKPGIASC